MRRELVTAMLAALLGSTPAFAQMGGIGSPGMGATSPLGISPAASGSVGPSGLPLGATETPTPGLSPAPLSTLGSGFTTCSNVVGAGAPGATGTFDGGGVGSYAGMPQSVTTATPSMTTTGMSTGSTDCSQSPGTASTSTLQSTTSSHGVTAPLGIGTIPMGSTELPNGGVSPAPCPMTGSTLPTNSDATAQGAC